MSDHRASDGGRIDDVLEVCGSPLLRKAKFRVRDLGLREGFFEHDMDKAYELISEFVQRITDYQENSVYLVPMNPEEYKAYCAQRDAQQELPRSQPERIALLLQNLQQELSTGTDAREKSLRFLRAAGIIDKDGQLAPQYREQPEQAKSS